MKQICPHCLKSVSVPEDAAGKDVTCPECGQSFPAPARYNPVVSAPPPTAPAPTPVPTPPPPAVAPAPVPVAPAGYSPAPPPGLVPTALVPPAGAAPSAVPAAPVGYTRSVGIVLSPRLMSWLPAVTLMLTLMLTFFIWVGSYFGGTAVYYQSPWHALIGRVGRNFQQESVAATVQPRIGAWLDKVRSDWELMLPYLLLLILATILAWADRFITELPPANRIPPPLRWTATIWPHRAAILAGLATLALGLVILQAYRGFGMERAVRQTVAEQFAEQRQKAADSPSKLETIDYAEQQELDKYKLERTTWMYLGIGLHVLAVVGIALRAGLDRREGKPPPRIVIQY